MRQSLPPCDVLILSASYGAGHNHVARALDAALRRRDPGLRVETRDFFAMATPRINRLTQVGYVQLVRHFPPGYRWFYNATRSIRPDSALQRWLNSLGRRRVLELVQTTRPRVVVCTFPTPAGVLSALRGHGADLPPVVTVITDVVVHRQWIHPHVDAYIVPDESVASGLVQQGIAPHRIHPLGIPLRRNFEAVKPREEIRASFGLDGDLFTVLVMGGAFGMLGGVVDLCAALANIPERIQVVAVSGHNRLLLERLRLLRRRVANPLHVFGYVENVADLMDVSQVLASKAGGITVYEALAKGLPMLVYRPIPGQEEGNARFLEAIGAGTVFTDPAGMAAAVRALRDDPEGLMRMRAAALAHAKPRAADDAADLVLRLARGNRQTLSGSFGHVRPAYTATFGTLEDRSYGLSAPRSPH